MAADQQNSRQSKRLKRRVKPLGGVVCLLLVSLLATIQITHEHRVGADTSHCPLCIILHTAAPVTPTAAVVVIVPMGRRPLVFKTRPLVRYWRPKFFTRPPPAGC